MNSPNQQTTVPTESPDEPNQRFERIARLFWASLLMAPLPLVLYPIHSSLLRVPSLPVYVFGVLIWSITLLAFFTLVFRRWDRVSRLASTVSGRVLLGAGFASYFFGFFCWSIELATIGWTLHAAAWLATHSGVKDSHGWNLLIHWPALCMLLQTPEIFEEKLRWLYQEQLALVTSTCFDFFSIPFRREHSHFELARCSFSVDDIMVNSPHMAWMLFTCCVIVSWLRRPVVLIPAYLAVAMVWTFGMHLTQLILFGLAQHWYHVDLSTGWPSVLLLASTLLAAIGLIFSSDRCLQILFMPLPVDDSSQDSVNPINRVWNRWLLPLAVDYAGDA
jgi:hypothetical protein